LTPSPSRQSHEVAMTSSNKFANGSNQNAGNVITDRSTTRIHHAPGGASSICLGDGSSGGMFADARPSPKSASGYGQQVQQAAPQPASAPKAKTPQQLYAEELRMQVEAKNAAKAGNKAAALQAERADMARVERESAELRAEIHGEVAKQRQRETITDQRSSQLASYLAKEQGAGGHGVVLGSTDENLNTGNFQKGSEQVSSNKFACGANQNCGNVITDRSSTRIHHAPGGKSSIVLG